MEGIRDGLDQFKKIDTRKYFEALTFTVHLVTGAYGEEYSQL